MRQAGDYSSVCVLDGAWHWRLAVPGLSLVCMFCAHQFSYRRCTTFPEGIPLAIWLGKDTHQASYPGDHGIRFSPVPGAVVTTPQVSEGDKVLWSLLDEEPVREPHPV